MCKFQSSNRHTITYDLVRQAQGDKPYTMSLVGKMALAVQKAVNIGIDSHLEACYVPDRGDEFKDGVRKIKGVTVQHTLECRVSAESLPVLLRRLYEMENEHDESGESAAGLADDILESIGINLDTGERAKGED